MAQKQTLDIKHKYIDKDGKEVIILNEAPMPIESKKRNKVGKYFKSLKRYK
jgi:hypothetical protein